MKVRTNKTLSGIVVVAAILFSSAVLAQEHDFEEAKSIIESKITCSQLTNEQFEQLGDYFMEQMHPGELHEIMDERMGGEGSAQLRNVHISMGRSFYCADNRMMSAPMMNMMMGRGGMMGSYPYTPYNSFSLTSVSTNILLIALVIVVIILTAKLVKKK